jgi:FlhB HrpN YscU SpaS Family
MRSRARFARLSASTQFRSWRTRRSRALHATVEIEQEIPAEHYQAVAEVISYVMRLKRGFARRN